MVIPKIEGFSIKKSIHIHIVVINKDFSKVSVAQTDAINTLSVAYTVQKYKLTKVKTKLKIPLSSKANTRSEPNLKT